MPDHRREQVMDAFVTTLTGLTTVGANVSRRTAYSIDDANLPHYNIFQGADVPVSDFDDAANYTFIDHDLDIMVEMRVQGTGDMEEAMNLIEKEAAVAVHADYTLGLSFVLNTDEGETSEPVIRGDGETKILLATKRWTVRYRRSRSDPSA